MTKTTTASPLTFVNWSHRPAVIVADKAFAVLRPGGHWTQVDRWDVGQTGAVFSERHWRQYFHREGYDRLDLDVWRFRNFEQDNEPQSKPLPRKKDFDDAVRAVYAAWLEHNPTDKAR
jgi:hypothetical protein